MNKWIIYYDLFILYIHQYKINGYEISGGNFFSSFEICKFYVFLINVMIKVFSLSFTSFFILITAMPEYFALGKIWGKIVNNYPSKRL